jgi:hypothetical protein
MPFVRNMGCLAHDSAVGASVLAELRLIHLGKTARVVNKGYVT